MSPSEQRLLREIKNKGPQHCAKFYTPAVLLVEQGLAEWTGPNKTRLKITDKGNNATEQGTQISPFAG